MPVKCEDGGPLLPHQPMSGANIKSYIDDQMDQCLDFKQVMMDAEEIILSFNYPQTDKILNRMNKKTLEVFYEHVSELKLKIEKRLFEET